MASYIHLTGFMEDTIFHKDLRLIINNNNDQGIGYLNSILVDYFVSIGELKDTRISRLSVINSGAPATGKCTLFFDNKVIEDPNFWTTAITNEQINTIFNISEFCYLNQNQDIAYIEHMLTTDSVFTNLYVPESVAISTVTNPITISDPFNTSIRIPNWVEFQIYLTPDKEKILKVKLWLSSNDFSKNYPYTTITKVIPPCPPETLFNTVKGMSQMETMIESSKFTFIQMHQDLVANDQAGAISFNTKYYLGVNIEYTIAFAVLYKGAKQPTTMACRAAIKEYLLSTGLTTLDNLETLFPELFVDYQFYIIPLWDHKKELEDRTVYPSISPTYAYIKEVIDRIYPNLNEDYMDTRIQIILNAESDIFSLVVPNVLNPDLVSLLDLHPIFTRRAAGETAYNYMTVKTKQLADKLARVFAVFNADVATNEFASYIEDEREYLTFTVGNTELQVLSPTGYHYVPEVS